MSYDLDNDMSATLALQMLRQIAGDPEAVRTALLALEDGGEGVAMLHAILGGAATVSQVVAEALQALSE